MEIFLLNVLIPKVLFNATASMDLKKAGPKKFCEKCG